MEKKREHHKRKRTKGYYQVSKENSEMNFLLQASTVGCKSLNIYSIRVVQMFISTMTAMKKGTFKRSLICLMICRTGLVVTTDTPIGSQQAFTKLHLRKRCATVSLR
jgi:hypothetical protein